MHVHDSIDKINLSSYYSQDWCLCTISDMSDRIDKLVIIVGIGVCTIPETLSLTLSAYIPLDLFEVLCAW